VPQSEPPAASSDRNVGSRALRRVFVGMGDLLVTLIRNCIVTAEKGNVFFHGVLSPGVREKASLLARSAKGLLAEVGCGDGLFLIPLAQSSSRSFVGTDIFDPTFNEAKRRVRRLGLNNLYLVKGDALALPYRDHVFGAVVCINTLNSFHTKQDVGKAVLELGRVCQAGGFAIVDYRNSHNWWMRYRFQWRKALHEESKLPSLTFSPEEMRDMLAAAGFKIIDRLPVGLPFTPWAPAVVLRARKGDGRRGADG